MQNELIIVSEYCRKCHIEPSFIDLLQEGGLIEVKKSEEGNSWKRVAFFVDVCSA